MSVFEPGSGRARSQHRDGAPDPSRSLHALPRGLKWTRSAAERCGVGRRGLSARPTSGDLDVPDLDRAVRPGDVARQQRERGGGVLGLHAPPDRVAAGQAGRRRPARAGAGWRNPSRPRRPPRTRPARGGGGGGRRACRAACPQRRAADHRGRPLNPHPGDRSRLGARCRSTPATAPTVGRERELEQLEAALDALAAGRPGLRGGRGRARASARRACSPSCATAPRSAAASCSPARRRSSSATCRSASGSTRSTPTSPRRSSTCDEALGRGARSRARRGRSRRCGARRGARRLGRRRALPRPPRRARGCSSCSRPTGRSCSCSTTCTGATARRSS